VPSSIVAPEPPGSDRLRAAIPWAVGVVLALLVTGPALGPGLLLNLDLVLTHDPPVPNGVWGLGPELPRGLPFQVPLAWLSTLLDGALIGKGVMVGVIVVAFVGAHRLAAGAPTTARVAAGLVYAGGPFLATRLAIGHLGTAAAAALLPWALPTLLRPGDSLRRTLLWSAALGFWGVNGGILAGVVVLTGLVADRGRRAPGVLGALLAGQLPWVVPGIVVSLQGIDPAGAENFATRLDGPLGLLRLAGGQGYFIEAFDVGADQVLVPLVALVLVVAALAGWSRLPEAWGSRATVLAAIGFVVAATSGVPGVDGVYAAVADSPLGLPLREGQRILPLFLVWLAAASAQGWGRLTPRFEGAGLVGLGLSVILVGPALWGFGGQLEPLDQPPEWTEARRVIREDPGPVLALPWGQYVRPTVIDGLLVHHPLPYVFGGDVLLASGQGDEDAPNERADPRQDVADALTAHLRARESADAELAALGIRWVALLETVDPGYPGLAEDPALEVAVGGPTLTLYRVRDSVTSAVDPVIGPWARVEGREARTWFRPGASGWLRGWSAAPTTADGNVGVPAGTGSLWYWPSLLVLAADGITVGALVLTALRDRRS